jgi:hypothetical protein
MVKIPKKLKVGGQTLDVVFPCVFKEDDAMVGLHESREARIKIAGTYRGEPIPDSRIKQTFIHEVLHAVDFYYLCHTLTDDEAVIDRFASGWFNVFMNNNLNLKSNKFELPKVVKVQDYLYKVIYPYEYSDMFPAPLFSVDTNMTILRFSHEHLKCSLDVLRMNLVHALTVVINCENDILGTSRLANNDHIANFPKDAVIELFSNGIFQVIIDNDLEKVIKNG